jgi:cardiolipin synthase
MWELLKLPNLLSVARLALAPVAALAILDGEFHRALALCAAASVTDALDGYLARALGLGSRLGQRLDPIADKVFLSVIYIALAARGAAPWWLVLLILGRDTMILAFAALAMLLTPLRRFPPSRWGKVSTLFQMVTALGVIIAHAFPAFPFTGVLRVLFGVTATGTAWSGLHYAWLGARMVRSANPSVR